MPKANVQLSHVGTQLIRTTTADANGAYNFVSLAPGYI